MKKEKNLNVFDWLQDSGRYCFFSFQDKCVKHTAWQVISFQTKSAGTTDKILNNKAFKIIIIQSLMALRGPYADFECRAIVESGNGAALKTQLL